MYIYVCDNKLYRYLRVKRYNGIFSSTFLPITCYLRDLEVMHDYRYNIISLYIVIMKNFAQKPEV